MGTRGPRRGVARVSHRPQPDPQPEVLGAGVLGCDGCDKRRQQFRDRLGADRRARVHSCLAGRCGVIDEPPMICLHWGWSTARRVARACKVASAAAQITKGHASLGCFMCPQCRVREAIPGIAVQDMPQAALDIADVTMLVQLSSGAEATGASSYFDYQRLERDFMQSIGALVEW